MKMLERTITIVVILMLVSIAVWAQGPPPSAPPAAGAPLDGFTVALLAVGAGYGVKRIRNKK